MHGSPIVRIGARRQAGHDVGHEPRAVEVAEQQAGMRAHPVQGRRNPQATRHESTGPRRVNHKIRAQAVQHGVGDVDAIAVIDARRHGRADEMMVHIGTQPVVVGNMVGGTRRHEQSF